MRIARFYHDEDIIGGATVELNEAAAHHARDVLRLREGETIALFNARQGELSARIVRVDKRGVNVAIGAPIESAAESPLRIVLGQAISAADKMDFTLQKAVELGVQAIQPLSSERSIIKLSPERAEKRRAHWQGIVISATEQSGRTHLADLAPVCGLREWLAQKPKQACGLMLTPRAPTRLVESKRPDSPIWLLIGPEGGLAEAEVAAALSAGFMAVALGPRVLRTETAALAAIAAMQALWGDF